MANNFVFLEAKFEVRIVKTMEVVSISEVIIDGTRVKHTGVLVMLREQNKVNLFLYCVDDNKEFETVNYDVAGVNIRILFA